MTRRARVGDVMLRRPKTSALTTSVARARRLLGDDHVHVVLLVDSDRLIGTITRDDLPPTARADALALAYASLRGRTVGPDADAERLRTRMVTDGIRRLAVVDGDGRLLGLLCLKRSQRGFCGDRDVAARTDAARASTSTRPG